MALLVVSHGIYAIYTLVLRPYKEFFVNFADFCCDIVVTLYYICILAFGETYSDSKAKGLAGFLIAAQVILSTVVGVYSVVKIAVKIL